jgi:cytochrome c5
MYKLILTVFFSAALLLSGLQKAKAETPDKVADKIQPESDSSLSKAVLEKKFNLVAGKKSYSSAGFAICHDNTVMGAPKPGDKKAWISRLNNGWDQIVKHSLLDYKSMPAKGGNKSLSEIDLENIDAYLVSLVVS